MIKITDTLLNDVAKSIPASKRGRINYNFHKNYSEKVQRFLNIANKNSYVRPHKHENPDKTEVFIILKGRVLMLEFDEKGSVRDHSILDAAKGNFGAEIAPRIWHTFIALEDNSAVYELKEGPFDPAADKHFAPWAPEEGTKEAVEFNRKLLAELRLRG